MKITNPESPAEHLSYAEGELSDVHGESKPEALVKAKSLVAIAHALVAIGQNLEYIRQDIRGIRTKS